MTLKTRGNVTALHHARRLALLLFLSSSFAPAADAEGLDCNATSSAAESAICKDPNLSDLAVLANTLGSVTGLDIRYAATDVGSDFGMYRGISRLLSTLNINDVDALLQAPLPAPWSLTFDAQNAVLFIHSSSDVLQNGVVVFDPTANGSPAVLFSELYDADDAGRYSYDTIGNVLEITSRFQPALIIEKYRFQDDCWRLIGSDAYWAGYMVEFDDDIEAHSINYLTGRGVFDFKVDKGVVRTFDPVVQCRGASPSTVEINYHDAQ